LRAIGASGIMPNLILSGPPGCGKTTSVHALSRQLLGESYMKEAVLELNASDDRGIDVVRSKIKTFAQQKITLPPGRQKIVILDEADSMTEGAQQAMRRTMEQHSDTTRFALACNESTKIIEPIQSRCAILRFTRVSEKAMTQRLKQILDIEKAEFDESGIDAIIFSAEGDMRNALNNLQSTINGFGSLTREHVFRVCDAPNPEKISFAIRSCLNQKFSAAYVACEKLYNIGYPGQDIVGMFWRILKTYDMPEHVKLSFLKEVGVYQMRAHQANLGMVQIAGLIGRLCTTAHSLNVPPQEVKK